MALRLETIRQMSPEEKIISFDEAAALLGELSFAGAIGAVVPGVYDVVHRGHVHFLRAARAIDPERSVVIIGI